MVELINGEVVLSKLDRNEQALGAAAEAVRVRQDDPQAWYDRGIAFGNLNRDEDALECFERAIQLKRDCGSVE